MTEQEHNKFMNGTEHWTELKEDLENIIGIVTVREEDDSKWGHRAGSKGYVVTDKDGNVWRIGQLFKVSECPFDRCVNAVIGKPDERKKPNPTIYMTLMSLYYQYLYTSANNEANRVLTCVFGHQKYRMTQRMQLSKNDNLPDKFLRAEYKRRFEIFEKIRHDARIGLFSDKGTESIMNYVDKRYNLPFMLNKDIAQTLSYSIHPDAFWPSADDIDNYVAQQIAKNNQMKLDMLNHKPDNSWTEIYGTE